MTHFTRNKRLLTAPGVERPLLMDGQVINNAPMIKIFGVILDQGLRYKEYISAARDKGIKAALALKRLKNLRPEVAKKLFYSKATFFKDYASPIWGPAAAQCTNHR